MSKKLADLFVDTLRAMLSLNNHLKILYYIIHVTLNLVCNVLLFISTQRVEFLNKSLSPMGVLVRRII